jgi:hypothetical protein
MNRHVLFAALFTAATYAAAENRTAELDRAYANVVAARQALADARERRVQGVEPLPGERLGTAFRKSRLAEAYFERQKELESEVERAHRRLDEALARWNALR